MILVLFIFKSIYKKNDVVFKNYQRLNSKVIYKINSQCKTLIFAEKNIKKLTSKNSTKFGLILYFQDELINSTHTDRIETRIRSHLKTNLWSNESIVKL